jgi:hypothetical protein
MVIISILKSISGLFWRISILFFLKLSGSGGVGSVSLVLMLLTSENIGVIYCQIKCKQTIALPL